MDKKRVRFVPGASVEENRLTASLHFTDDGGVDLVVGQPGTLCFVYVLTINPMGELVLRENIPQGFGLKIDIFNKYRIAMGT